MNQLELLTIRKQPKQSEPKIPARTIQAYVHDKLEGFAQRQAERARLRKLYQSREKRNKEYTDK